MFFSICCFCQMKAAGVVVKKENMIEYTKSVTGCHLWRSAVIFLRNNYKCRRVFSETFLWCPKWIGLLGLAAQDNSVENKALFSTAKGCIYDRRRTNMCQEYQSRRSASGWTMQSSHFSDDPYQWSWDDIPEDARDIPVQTEAYSQPWSYSPVCVFRNIGHKRISKCVIAD